MKVGCCIWFQNYCKLSRKSWYFWVTILANFVSFFLVFSVFIKNSSNMSSHHHKMLKEFYLTSTTMIKFHNKIFVIISKKLNIRFPVRYDSSNLALMAAFFGWSCWQTQTHLDPDMNKNNFVDNPGVTLTYLYCLPVLHVRLGRS